MIGSVQQSVPERVGRDDTPSISADIETGTTVPAPTPRQKRTRRSVEVERWPVDTKVAVKFGAVVYTARVSRILQATDEDPKLWHVIYDDNDEEDLDEEEMADARNLYVNGDGNDSVSTSDDDVYDPFE